MRTFVYKFIIPPIQSAYLTQSILYLPQTISSVEKLQDSILEASLAIDIVNTGLSKFHRQIVLKQMTNSMALTRV